MIKLLSQADAIAARRHELTALQVEQALLDLGFHSVSFPKRGPIRAFFENIEYELGT
jgi:hypothetical protein